MIESIQIRFAETDDIPVLVQLLTALISLESDFDENPERIARGFQLLLSDPNTRRVFVAEKDGEVVGMCTGQLYPSSVEGGLVLLIEDFIVHESVRSQGIGKQLILSVEQWGVEKGAKRFQLFADRDKARAHNFYKQQGWSESSLTYLFKHPE